MKVQRIPPATVARLPIYRQCLQSLLRQGEEVTSSHRLADATGIEAPQIRRDLSYLGAFGTRGVGYEVEDLLREVSLALGLARSWPVALVGCGRLGAAIAAYEAFPRSEFHVAAIFDCDPSTIGARVEGVEVMGFSRIKEVVRAKDIGIGIVSTDPAWVRLAIDELADAGVSSILNLSPVTVSTPQGVVVRNVDLAAEMEILSFNEAMKRGGEAHPLVHQPTQITVDRWLKQWL